MCQVRTPDTTLIVRSAGIPTYASKYKKSGGKVKGFVLFFTQDVVEGSR